MHKSIVGMVVKGKGVVDKIVPMKDLAQQFRMADSFDVTISETIWAMVRRHAEEVTIKKEALWNEIAKALGYPSMNELHDDGFSLQIEHAEGNVLMIRSPADTGVES